MSKSTATTTTTKPSQKKRYMRFPQVVILQLMSDGEDRSIREITEATGLCATQMTRLVGSPDPEVRERTFALVNYLSLVCYGALKPITRESDTGSHEENAYRITAKGLRLLEEAKEHYATKKLSSRTQCRATIRLHSKIKREAKSAE